MKVIFKRRLQNCVDAIRLQIDFADLIINPIIGYWPNVYVPRGTTFLTKEIVKNR